MSKGRWSRRKLEDKAALENPSSLSLSLSLRLRCLLLSYRLQAKATELYGAQFKMRTLFCALSVHRAHACLYLSCHGCEIFFSSLGLCTYFVQHQLALWKCVLGKTELFYGFMYILTPLNRFLVKKILQINQSPWGWMVHWSIYFPRSFLIFTVPPPFSLLNK